MGDAYPSLRAAAHLQTGPDLLIVPFDVGIVK
jgi:hypothetical protein